jgi:hypothetical protein
MTTKDTNTNTNTDKITIELEHRDIEIIKQALVFFKTFTESDTLSLSPDIKRVLEIINNYLNTQRECSET